MWRPARTRPEPGRKQQGPPGQTLPLVHGSGLFQRGQTQVLSVLSLGMLNEGQRLDTIEPTEGKRYMHHYNFPPFCTGETGRMGSPKRREIGHAVMPSVVPQSFSRMITSWQTSTIRRVR